jgi:hypothetical protein
MLVGNLLAEMDYDARFFTLGFLCISFLQTPECPKGTISNFYKNSQRYSQLNVNQRYQRHRRLL